MSTARKASRPKSKPKPEPSSGGLKLIRLPRDEDQDYFAALNKLLDQIFEIATEHHKWTWGRLARESQLGWLTVSNLGDRHTKYPHLRTVLRMAQAVGLQVKLVPVVSVPKTASGKKKLRAVS